MIKGLRHCCYCRYLFVVNTNQITVWGSLQFDANISHDHRFCIFLFLLLLITPLWINSNKQMESNLNNDICLIFLFFSSSLPTDHLDHLQSSLGLLGNKANEWMHIRSEIENLTDNWLTFAIKCLTIINER